MVSRLYNALFTALLSHRIEVGCEITILDSICYMRKEYRYCILHIRTLAASLDQTQLSWKMSGRPWISKRTFIFFWLPILIALGVSIEYFVLAQKRESLSATDAFRMHALEVAMSVKLAWRITAMHPQFAASNLFSSKWDTTGSTTSTASLPVTAAEFEKFAASNIYWNKQGTMVETQWAPYIESNNRNTVEKKIDEEGSIAFQIFKFGANGKDNIPEKDPGPFAPIAYCSPPNPFIVGLDLYNDLVEGPVTRNTQRTGQTLSTAPFQLRGLPSNAYGGFQMGFTIYIPLFRDSSGNVTPMKTDDFLGVVVNVVAFQPLLEGILSDVQLNEIDVFLFTNADPVSGETERFLAMYQSRPYEGMTNFTVDEASRLLVKDITGDIVTSPDDPNFMVDMGDRTLRLVIRARTDRFEKKYVTFLPIVLMIVAILVKLVDKIFHFVDHWIYEASDEKATISKYLDDHELGTIDIDERRQSMEGAYSVKNLFCGWRSMKKHRTFSGIDASVPT
jgi:hypothetical protein